MIKIVISGCCGRMGSRIVTLAADDKDFKIVGATERENHPLLDKDLGQSLGLGKLGIKITDNFKKLAKEKFDCLIEFSTQPATSEHIVLAKKYKKAAVIGTTGLTDDQINEIKDLSKVAPVVMSPNMSIGVNLVFALVEDITRKLKEGYDVEILETHHRFKADAPSGTAKKIAEIIAQTRGQTLDKVAIYGRSGLIKDRPREQIAIHALRTGDVVGEHTVIFGNIGERIELTHRAHSRDTFALGALRAAKFVIGKPPKLYEMKDVLKV